MGQKIKRKNKKLNGKIYINSYEINENTKRIVLEKLYIKNKIQGIIFYDQMK